MRTMTARTESSAPTARRTAHIAAFRKQGALAGIFGASLLAAWFLPISTRCEASRLVRPPSWRPPSSGERERTPPRRWPDVTG